MTRPGVMDSLDESKASSKSARFNGLLLTPDDDEDDADAAVADEDGRT